MSYDSRTDKAHSQNGYSSRACKCPYCFPRMIWSRSIERMTTVQAEIDQALTDMQDDAESLSILDDGYQGECMDSLADHFFPIAAHLSTSTPAKPVRDPVRESAQQREEVIRRMVQRDLDAGIVNRDVDPYTLLPWGRAVNPSGFIGISTRRR